MDDLPNEKYLKVMQTIRERLDIINQTRIAKGDRFLIAENCAFNGRKIIEGIAFGCLIVLENGIGNVPRNVQNQWNAEKILSLLEKNNLGGSFPSPSVIRPASLDENREHNASITYPPKNTILSVSCT